jgi:hypothetical protein
MPFMLHVVAWPFCIGHGVLALHVCVQVVMPSCSNGWHIPDMHCDGSVHGSNVTPVHSGSMLVSASGVVESELDPPPPHAANNSATARLRIMKLLRLQGVCRVSRMLKRALHSYMTVTRRNLEGFFPQVKSRSHRCIDRKVGVGVSSSIEASPPTPVVITV